MSDVPVVEEDLLVDPSSDEVKVPGSELQKVPVKAFGRECTGTSFGHSWTLRNLVEVRYRSALHHRRTCRSFRLFVDSSRQESVGTELVLPVSTFLAMAISLLDKMVHPRRS
jgi:hypothetical protein